MVLFISPLVFQHICGLVFFLEQFFFKKMKVTFVLCGSNDSPKENFGKVNRNKIYFGGLARWLNGGKVLAAKLNDLSSISGTYIVEEEN